MDMVTRIERTQQMGGEFLTWLWYRADLNEGVLQVGDRPVEVWFDAKLALESLGAIKEQNVIRSETPTETEEARASLQSGKHVREAQLRLICDQKAWALTLRGEDLSMHGVKIPALLTSEADDRLYERLALLEEVEGLVDGLFQEFARVRLDDDAWRSEVEAIRDWIHPARN
ncbi:MAG: hypothetical protein VX938_03625 [Myxococcota bacterium]|nr:hypothetical protein [Myxococcota bacterium]